MKELKRLEIFADWKREAVNRNGRFSCMKHFSGLKKERNIGRKKYK
jgi:hypothetical protein